jgi:ribose-phosphate pyrophosphokinase
MSFIKTTGEKKLMLFAGRSHPELAEAVAEEVGIELTPTTAYDFANGEIFVRYKESVRGCDAFVLQSPRIPCRSSTS